MTRAGMLARLGERPQDWDVVVVGGGATGVGVAIDAASRGYRTVLLEAYDFGKGTSSRSTKLVHGGVRYLEQGNLSLVKGALRERGILRRNAPHLVSDLAFVIPNYEWWEAPFYGIGLSLYNLLSGKYGFGSSRILSREETLEYLPNVSRTGLRGGVVYYDGQFDDARLLMNMVTTAYEHGAALLNYAAVTGFTRRGDGSIDGVIAMDRESGGEMHLKAKVVVNATGPFTDEIRKLANASVQPMIAPSQGVHLVFDRSFLPGNAALMAPHTSDKRILFAIPWHGHTVVGTTDTAIPRATLEPEPLREEVDFLLRTANRYFERAPGEADILSVFTGIRPLVKRGQTGNSATLSRDHTIHEDQSGLLTITGGKWTTYRHMAEDCVNHAAALGNLPKRECVTRELRIHGWAEPQKTPGPFAVYGSDAATVESLTRENPALAAPLDPALPYVAAEVVWAVRQEMAMDVEDVLARRTRSLFLNAAASLAAAPKTAALMATELGASPDWERRQVEEFGRTASHFLSRGESGLR